MSTHKSIDKICVAAILTAVLIAVAFLKAAGSATILTAASVQMGYEDRLFDTEMVHTIDIVMKDWDSFIDTCENEEYEACDVIIDDEVYRNVGIRAKGNTSLSMVSSSDSDRYSFKIEFDQYEDGKSYHGLDKLSLNNIIQDNTYMKDYLVYQMMGQFGVNAPLCSYVYITVNGEDWGLYLAVEGVEDSFLKRNYGNDTGELYKPDSSDIGGGRGNGKDFQMPDDWQEDDGETGGMPEGEEAPGGFEDGEQPEMPDGGNDRGRDGGNDRGRDGGNDQGPGGGMGSSDVKLQYIDDDPDSYTNIFDNAKTDITEKDQERLIETLKQLSSNENIENVVDIDAVIRYFVVHNFVCNGDSYTGSMVHNYYLYEKDGMLSMIPWDYNLAFGAFQSSGDATSVVNEAIDTPVSGGSVDDRPMIAWIFNNEEYTELYHQYFSEFIQQNFSDGYLEEMIESTKERIAPYVEQDPSKFCTYEEFETGVDVLKEFCSLRAESVSGQLEGTIPSTSAGQNEDSSSLVDASGISISDMGSMGNVGGGPGRMSGGFGGMDEEPGGMGGGFGGIGEEPGGMGGGPGGTGDEFGGKGRGFDRQASNE